MPQLDPEEKPRAKNHNPTGSSPTPRQSLRPRKFPAARLLSQGEEPEPRVRSKLERTRALLVAALRLWEIKKRIRD